MTFLEQLPPGQRLIAAALLLALIVWTGIGLVRLVDRAIDRIVALWAWIEARGDARRRNAPPRWSR